MQMIYSYIEPWIIDQSVYLVGDNEEAQMIAKVPLTSMADYIAVTYVEKNCDKVILHGSNYSYTTEVANQITNYCMNNYGLNNINVEVIRE